MIAEKTLTYKGITMLFKSSPLAISCMNGNREIRVPKKKMIGVVTKIQNIVLPMRLMLAYRIAIVPPQNDKNVVAIKILGSVIIRISSNPGSIGGKLAEDSRVVTAG